MPNYSDMLERLMAGGLEKQDLLTAFRRYELEQKKRTYRVPRIVFDFKEGKFGGLLEQDKNRWRIAYPAVDIEQLLLRMEAWIMANPSKRKKIYGRFINNWLAAEQDNALRRPSTGQTAPLPVPMARITPQEAHGHERWHRTLLEMERRIGNAAVRSWLLQLRPAGVRGDVFVLECASRFAIQKVRLSYAASLSEILVCPVLIEPNMILDRPTDRTSAKTPQGPDVSPSTSSPAPSIPAAKGA